MKRIYGMKRIYVTGDVAFAGQPAEYDLARRFFHDLRAASGLAADRLFLVPGNHDVDRSAISLLAAGAPDILSSRETANRFLDSDTDRALVMQRFRHYREFVNGSFPHLRFDDDRYYYAERLAAGEHEIAILGLNSAWLAHGGDGDRHRLLLGERQVRHALALAIKAPEPALCLALMHHPFDWLQDYDRADAESLLCGACDFVLHGHMHQVGLPQARTPDTEAMIVAAGACYATRCHPNAYNFVQLDLAAKTGAVHLRTYSDRQGGFWTRDTANYRNVPNGVYRFALPGDPEPNGSGAGALRPGGESGPLPGPTITSEGGTLIIGDVHVRDGDFVAGDRDRAQRPTPSEEEDK